jgi:hypothetical protein
VMQPIDVQPPGDPIERDSISPSTDVNVRLRNIAGGDKQIEDGYHTLNVKLAAIGQSEADKASGLEDMAAKDMAAKDMAAKLLIELCAVMDDGMRDGLLIRPRQYRCQCLGQA